MTDMIDAFESDNAVVTRPAAAESEFYGIVCHPAFRLGFLDARAGRR